METTETQRKIAEALRSKDNRAIDQAVQDWLQGLHTDRELSDIYTIEAESYDTGTPARQVKDDKAQSMR